MKKFTKVLTVVIAAATLVPTIIFAKSFPDVGTGWEWAAPSISKLADQGIIKGFNDGKYYPNKYVSFEETAKLLTGLLNPTSSELAKARSEYKDTVKKYGVSDWAIDSVSYMLYREIMSVSDVSKASSMNYFKMGADRAYPERNAVAVYYAKALGLSGSGDTNLLKHNDIDKIPAVTKGYLASLVDAGIFKSTGSEGYFNGSRGIRRSEMALITDTSYEYLKSGKVAGVEQTVEAKIFTDPADYPTAIIVKISGRSNASIFKLDENTKIEYKGNKQNFSSLKKDLLVKITYKPENTGSDNLGTATKIDIIDKNFSDSQTTGYIRYIGNNNLTIDYRSTYLQDEEISTAPYDRGTETNNFTLASNAQIYKLGKRIYGLNGLEQGDRIEFTANNRKEITNAIVYPRTGKVEGATVVGGGTNSGFTNYMYITVRLDDNKEYKFYVHNSLRDAKLSSSAGSYNQYYQRSFGDYASGSGKGDIVSFDTNYKVVAGSTNYDVEGYVTGTNSWSKPKQIQLDNGRSYNLKDDYKVVDEGNNGWIPFYDNLDSLRGKKVGLRFDYTGQYVEYIKILGRYDYNYNYYNQTVVAEGTIDYYSNNYYNRYKVYLNKFYTNDYYKSQVTVRGNNDGYVTLNSRDEIYGPDANGKYYVRIYGYVDNNGYFKPDSRYEFYSYK